MVQFGRRRGRASAPPRSAALAVSLLPPPPPLLLLLLSYSAGGGLLLPFSGTGQYQMPTYFIPENAGVFLFYVKMGFINNDSKFLLLIVAKYLKCYFGLFKNYFI